MPIGTLGEQCLSWRIRRSLRAFGRQAQQMLLPACTAWPPLCQVILPPGPQPTAPTIPIKGSHRLGGRELHPAYEKAWPQVLSNRSL